ncbi:acyl- -binding domain-containing 4 isoform X1 [Pelobates cultripes]|uniref:Acyl- -binding domain-containing 4 isoform X1 n=1 Tax=Pelobates cultripes TaxID=61616 RepID=A0AAD1SLV3_PELCU|nr:acyl- -binding domain-containing 4 isoform X1 [Pelobates cultripes]
MLIDQDETEPQRQFNAAVSVIQGLPKNGAYRPSYEEMLRFYSYYKQATVGPCSIPRPGFWDPIGRYKWDAWNRLGDMSQDDAMCAYIKEMKSVAQKIIDTVPLDDKSPDMFEPFRPLYEVIPDMPRPPDSFFKETPELGNPDDEEPELGLKEVVCSPSAAFQTSIPQDEQVWVHSQSDQQGEEIRSDPIGEASNFVPHARDVHSWASSNEDFCDSIEEVERVQVFEDIDSQIKPHLFQPASDATTPNEHSRRQKRTTLRDTECDVEIVTQSTSESWLVSSGETFNSDMPSGSQIRKEHSPHQLSPQIAATVDALQASIQGISQRLESLEKMLQAQLLEETPHQPDKEMKSWISLFIQSRTLFFIFVWPFIVHWLLRRSYRWKR